MIFRARNLIISAERWVDARDWARKHFGDADVDAVLCADTEAHVFLRWVGHDAGAHPNKRMEVRWAGGKWEAA